MAPWIVFICLVITSWAHELPFEGKCPSFDPMEHFNPIGMLGDWYCVEGGKNGTDEEDIRCVGNDYSFQISVSINNSMRVIQVPSKTVDGPLVPHALIEGEMAQESAPIKVYFTLVYSDYKDCTVTILCYTNDTNYGYGAQVYSRTTTLSTECQQKAQEVLAARDITVKLNPVVQNCDNTASNPLRYIGIFMGNLKSLTKGRK